MAYSSINSTTNFSGVDTDQPSSETTLPGKIAYFAKVTVRIALIGAGALLFPATMVVVLISGLFHSYSDKDMPNMPRTVKIKRAVAAMIFVVPVIGPIITLECFGALNMPNGSITKSDVALNLKWYPVLCVPFVSSLLISLALNDLYSSDNET
ncbi:MAG: hypothetical protein KAG53_05130 [Endozoicomonadaceae bacterium]|nr:hypothetical protein [Endozoicomonadaceae bacterium]